MFYSGKYQYRGIAKLSAEPFTEEECDRDGVPRVVWKFPLKLINEKDVMDIEAIEEREAHLHQQVMENMSSALTLFMSASKMVLSGNERTVKAKRTQFNPIIGEYVRIRSGGRCELCGCKAPFEYKGKPYLELAHLVPFSEGGKDTADNIAAVCPNCHAKIDKLMLAEDKEMLKRSIKTNEEVLRKKLNGEE